MSYIVRVVGYNAYWTGVKESLWSDKLTEACHFDTIEEANEIVNSGRNMEAVSFEDATNSMKDLITAPDFA